MSESKEITSIRGDVVSEKTVFDVGDIIKTIPHRYPFLLIDKVVHFEDNQRIISVKSVSVNEPFFQGHFPARPVMPGVLVLEAMAQTGAMLAHKSSDGVVPGKTVFIVGATDVKWKKMVVPGDTLKIDLISVRKRRPMWVMDAIASVDGRVVSVAKLSAMEAD
jgi:3-hydroxyacyl-[acyl-carrier-protein] dehydratase